MKKLLICASAATMALGLGGCTALLGAGAGAAAATYYVDGNDVCDPPTDAGLLDDDC
ncbi:hypothetical protein G7A66_09440 [Altererythrobacter sp. SALINAS58]|uniref:hypothetical protein n=1 Tax=Alteripontixanthobacter muriae TaxID=2705546 RepID=UPI001575177B|nr:hypothetical protein [Alteripontixanthobacter muriae]NTZ43305.1 hypothetical protein [Alteripontixanthobacter muriae]